MEILPSTHKHLHWFHFMPCNHNLFYSSGWHGISNPGGVAAIQSRNGWQDTFVYHCPGWWWCAGIRLCWMTRTKWMKVHPGSKVGLVLVVAWSFHCEFHYFTMHLFDWMGWPVFIVFRGTRRWGICQPLALVRGVAKDERGWSCGERQTTSNWMGDVYLP